MKRKMNICMTTEEYLQEHLYEYALNDGFKQEWIEVKRYAPILVIFPEPMDFIRAVENNPELREQILEELVRLWDNNYQLRQATGVFLMLAIWRECPLSSDSYYELFLNPRDYLIKRKILTR